MERREALGDSSIQLYVLRVYKSSRDYLSCGIVSRLKEFKARLEQRNKMSIVIFENSEFREMSN